MTVTAAAAAAGGPVGWADLRQARRDRDGLPPPGHHSHRAGVTAEGAAAAGPGAGRDPGESLPDLFQLARLLPGRQLRRQITGAVRRSDLH